MKEAQEQSGSDSHEYLMKVLRNPDILKDKIQEFVETESEVLGESVNEIVDLSNYVIANWRVLVPPLVAFGLSVLLKQTEPKKSKSNMGEPAGALLN